MYTKTELENQVLQITQYFEERGMGHPDNPLKTAFDLIEQGFTIPFVYKMLFELGFVVRVTGLDTDFDGGCTNHYTFFKEGVSIYKLQGVLTLEYLTDKDSIYVEGSIGSLLEVYDYLEKSRAPLFDDLVKKVISWADDRGLVKSENSFAQMIKVSEEVGETGRALLKGERENLKDGIGDSFVTLIILAAQQGLDPAECLSAAYNEIANRKGETRNGTFIKEEQ